MTRADRVWLAVAGAVAAAAAAQSWLAWLDPIIDAGRDLYIAEQLHLGARLYTDVLYVYPPLAPLLLGALTLLTGNSIAAYAAIGAVIALLTAFVLRQIAWTTAGPHAAGALLLLFAAFHL
ncbi:MAG TPA: hypothetical protein VF824_17350, partial [Thermoanaerobaculia bacterium]